MGEARPPSHHLGKGETKAQREQLEAAFHALFLIGKNESFFIKVRKNKDLLHIKKKKTNLPFYYIFMVEKSNIL